MPVEDERDSDGTEAERNSPSLSGTSGAMRERERERKKSGQQQQAGREGVKAKNGRANQPPSHASTPRVCVDRGNDGRCEMIEMEMGSSYHGILEQRKGDMP